jgi:hypothetical protein
MGPLAEPGWVGQEWGIVSRFTCFAAGLCLALFAPGCRAVDLSPSMAPPPGGSVVIREAPGGADGGMSDSAVPMPWVTIEAPAEGATFAQDSIVDGEWAANVTFTVRSSDVARVELRADTDFVLGDADAAGALTYAFFGVGLRQISAIGYDAAGVELARDEIAITIQAPADTSCHAMLDGLGLDWAPAGASPGIADPVRVQPIINGVAFRYVSNTEPTAMLMDCELAIRLYRLTEVVIPYGIDEVIHIGIYNYRCIGGGDPSTGCTPSQHAFARAIDLHAFGLAGSDDTYSTETDFVITRTADPCPIPSSNEKDRILKEIACTMWSERIFEIVLTPNYNADHRNHYHVDMTAGSMYLGEGVSGVDPAVPGLGD